MNIAKRFFCVHVCKMCGSNVVSNVVSNVTSNLVFNRIQPVRNDVCITRKNEKKIEMERDYKKEEEPICPAEYYFN